MRQGPITWVEDKPVTIQHKSHAYDVVFYYNAIERQTVYAFVRSEGSRYGVIEVHGEHVFFRRNSDYDDLYYYDGNEYRSIGQLDYLKFPVELDSREEFPLCLIEIGVNGLLTCHPIHFDYDNTEKMPMPFRYYPSFVCESFNDEYFYLSGGVYKHIMSTGFTGKGWYREIHGVINEESGPGQIYYDCYQYERNINSSMGKWLIEDGTCSEDKDRISLNVIARDILYVDLWRPDSIIIGVEVDGYYPRELLIYDKSPEIDLRDRIECMRWQIYETDYDTLFVIMYGQSIQLYSEKKGFLSDKYYQNLYLEKRLSNRSRIHLVPVKDIDHEQEDYLVISDSGEIKIESF